MNTSPAAEGALLKDCLIEVDDWKSESGLIARIEVALDTAQDYVKSIEGLSFTPDCEISLVFSDDETVRTLNAEHRGKDKATNVLSFPIDEDADLFGPMLGDIVFAYQTVKREAEELGVEISAHMTHLSVHGFLHLLGYDHIEADEADKMESVEIAILARLGLPNPYADTVPISSLD
ncbi:rRNA maturation RNase YbeY [uncultured Cohaesibacter sp.]|uniref:rRNA maturation RNase YbeY n=1 Tax=uncultured Cohaesibacter sp. TaxID=1002546 RepID=UPI00292D3EB7|nr:rRNA maturation RNase YbeY [uncultured Cohaesibacter sp.]